jgi:hypothetical protein
MDIQGPATLLVCYRKKECVHVWACVCVCQSNYSSHLLVPYGKYIYLWTSEVFHFFPMWSYVSLYEVNVITWYHVKQRDNMKLHVLPCDHMWGPKPYVFTWFHIKNVCEIMTFFCNSLTLPFAFQAESAVFVTIGFRIIYSRSYQLLPWGCIEPMVLCS